MTRTKLKDRTMPTYTTGEEIFNMVSHISGGAIAIVFTVFMIIKAALASNALAVLTVSLYGAFVITLYTMSSVYHGLKHGTAKRVFQVIDHCTIYFMIAGTYTPLTLCAIRLVNPLAGWLVFSAVWILCALAVTLTAIDLKKYNVFSMICYIGMGWCVIFSLQPTITALGTAGFSWLLAGGIFYTIGAIMYGFGKKHKYIHSIFHLFVVFGSIAHFICVLFYVL